jgi:stage V sporulation protein B
MLSAGTFNDINNELDVILIGYFLTSGDLGVYAVAVVLSKAFMIIPVSFQRITYPATSACWHENDLTGLRTMVDRSMKYCSILLVVIGMGVAFFARDIILFIFQEDFAGAIIPLQILLVTIVLRGGLATPIGGSIAAIGRPDVIFWINLGMLCVNALIDILLIPVYGITGAAIATMIALVGGTVLNVWLLSSYIDLSFDFTWFIRFFEISIGCIVIFFAGSSVVSPYLLGIVVPAAFIVIVAAFLLDAEDKSIIIYALESIIQRDG